jgi:hypothetical protein
MARFVAPEFKTGTVEIRAESDEVAIYGTREGLMRLATLCKELATKEIQGNADHIHLEDYELLTAKSRRATVAVFLSSPC